MVALLTLKENYRDKWFQEESSGSRTDIDLTELAGVQKVLAKIYDEYKNGTNNLGYAVNKAIKDSKVMDYIDDAYEWQFNGTQIRTLNEKVSEMLKD